MNLGENNNPQSSPTVLSLHSTTTATRAQVEMLLGIVRTLREVACDWERNDGVPAPNLDGDVRDVVDAAMIQAGLRLTEILEDRGRWGIGEVHSMLDSIRSVHKQQIATLKAQQAAHEEPVHPALLLRPRLVQLNGLWWAIAGETPEDRLCGTGMTPHAALSDFQKRYYSQIPDGSIPESNIE